MREAGDGIDRSGWEAAGPKKRQRLERQREYLARNGICFSLEKMVKATATGGTTLSLENRHERMLAALSKRRYCSLLQNA